MKMKKRKKLPEFFPRIGGPGEMYSYPPVIRPGPRSLHFRGSRPIPRLPELASSCVRPAAALREFGGGDGDRQVQTIEGP